MSIGGGGIAAGAELLPGKGAGEDPVQTWVVGAGGAGNGGGPLLGY